MNLTRRDFDRDIFQAEFDDPFAVQWITGALEDLHKNVMSMSVKTMLDMQEHLGFTLEGLEDAFALLDNIYTYIDTHPPTSGADHNHDEHANSGGSVDASRPV